jgi:hypothetical protein
MRRSPFCFMVMFLAFALGLPLAQGDQYATPNTGVCWDMDDLVTNSGGVVTGSSPEYTFHGSVTVSPLDTLIICAGNTLIFDETQGNFRLWAKGTLFAQGTVDGMITFTSSQMTTGAWQGITLYQGTLEYCRVEYAFYGIYIGYIESLASVTHSTIMSNHVGVFLVGPGDSTIISTNHIANNQVGGILGDGGINKNHMSGKQWGALIEDNQILDNGDFGIAFSWGIYALIKGNLISGHNSGIFCGPYGGFVVAENTIVENNLGILCDSYGLPSGINLGDLSNQSSEDDGRNQIHDNIEYDLYNANAETIKAEGNCWGTTDLVAIDSHIYDDQEDEGDADGNGVLSGPVDFVPIGETSVQPSTWGKIKARFK